MAKPERRPTAAFIPGVSAPRHSPTADMTRVSTNLPKVIEIDLEYIHPNPDQPRKVFDQAALNSLVDSIERYGQKQPILVRRDGVDHYCIVSGERRFRASQQLKRESIFAIVLGGDENADEIALLDNVQRVDLNALELAFALRRLLDTQRVTQSVLAKIVGKSEAEVSCYLRLTNLDSEIQSEYPAFADRIGMRALYEIAKADTQTQRLELWSLAKEGATVNEVIAAAQVAKATNTTANDDNAEKIPAFPARAAQPIRRVKAILATATKHFDELTSLRSSLDSEHISQLHALRDKLNLLLATT